MNAPVLVAQLSGSTPQAVVPPKNLKLEKPANGQAVTVHLDGNTKVDFTDIASEKLTLVKVGEKLIVLFDNQSTVTVEPVFDSLGNPLPEIAFLVGQDRTVTGDEFAALFPITTDQSVLPAAGGTGGPSAGANFSDASVNPLDANGNPLSLLGDENFGGPQFGTTTTGNPRPIFRGADVANLDDEGLADGNLDGPGDEPGSATSVTGSLNVDFGADRAGASFAFTAAQPGLAGLTSGGQAVNLFVGLVGGVPTIIGYVGADQNDPASQVFTVTINSAALEGQYTFTLLRPLDHSQHGTEDTLNLTIGFSATDGSGDVDTDVISININDDSPVILPALVDNPLPETSHQTLADPNGGVSERSGTLGISWGADRFNTHVDGGVSETTGHNGDRSVIFTNNAVTLTGHVQGSGEAPNVTFSTLFSHGEEVHFLVLENGTVLLAYTGEVPPNLPGTGEGTGEGENGDNFVSPNIVFIATLSDASNSGSYTITQYQELDHKSGEQNFDTLNLTLNYTATDSDGDPTAGTLTLTVNDDAPTIMVSGIENMRVYEDGNAGDTYANGGPEGVAKTAVGHLGVQWGADNTDTDDVGGVQDGAVSGSVSNAALTGRAIYFTDANVTANGVLIDADHPLTSHGETILFRLDDSGTTLIGYTGSGEVQHTVFTVSLSDDADGTYTFNLVGVLDHPVANSEDDIGLGFNFTARDFDGDTAANTFTVTVNDDAPVQSEATVTGSASENDLANFNPFYPVLFDFWQGSLGTSPYDGHTGALGTVPVYGNLSSLVLPGADGPGAFHLVSEADANAILAASGNSLSSHGDAIDHVQSINVPSVGDVMGFFASDGRLVFGLMVDADGNYNFRLFDQIDHAMPAANPSGAPAAVEDILNIDLSQFVTFTDFDGDKITLADGAFSVDVKDDIPVVVGRETGTVNENDLANFNPLYPLVFDFWQGSLGTSPFDGFSDDGSITGLFGTVPVYGFLTDNVIGGADEFGKFDLVSEQRAATLLATLNGGQPFKSHGDVIDHAEAINIPSLGEAMGFFASDGRLVFGLFVSESGFYNFRLFDQLDHAMPEADPSGAPVAVADTLTIDLSKFVTFTDFDHDTIDLGTNTFVISVIDDIPQVVGSLNVTLDESHLNNFVMGWDLIPDAIKALYPVEGSTGTNPGSDTDLLLNTTSQQGFLNEIIGSNLVNGGADEFGKFGLVSVARADAVLDGMTGWSSKGEAIDHVQVLDLGALGTVMGFFAGDRIVFTLTVNETGFYDLRLFDQIDHTGANGASIALDLSKFVTYTDFDGDAIDLGTSNFVLTVLDDAPEPVIGAHVYGTVEEEQVVLIGGDLAHGNEDMGSEGGDDRDTSTGLLSPGSLATSNVTFGSLAPLVKTGADENGTFSFIATVAGQAVVDSHGDPIMSRGQAVKYGFQSGQLVGFADANNNGTLDSGERLVFTVSLSELPFGVTIPGTAGLLDGKVNDQFTFTLLDQIDHANPGGASTEDVKNIDLSSTIKFTDADGDSIGFGPNSFEIKTIDDTPIQIAGKKVTGVVEEEQLPGGNEDTTSGVTPDLDLDTATSGFGANRTTATVSGDLRSLVSVGADEVTQATILGFPVPGTGVGQFSLDATNATLAITSNGKPVLFVVTDSNDAGTLGDLLTAYVDVDGNGSFDAAVDRKVFTLAIENNGASSGDYTFTLLSPIDHPTNANGEDVKSLDLSSFVRFSDFDGDTITLAGGTFTISVIDDIPTVSANAGVVVDDDDVPDAGGNPGVSGEGDTSPANVTGTLAHKYGADGAGSVLLLDAGAPAGFSYSVDATGTTLTISQTVGTGPSAVTTAVLKVVLSDITSGNYTVTQLAPIHHADGNNENNQALTIAYQVKDFDGDTAASNGTITITVNDDTPTVAPSQTTLIVDEEGLGGNAGDTYGSPNNQDVATSLASANGTLSYSFGADGASATTDIAFSTANLAALNLKSAGQALSYGWDQASHTLTASAGGNPVFTLTVTNAATGAYTFTQLKPLDHPVAGSEDNITIPFNFTIKDSDNDARSGTVSVTINDDAPTFNASNVANGLIDEEGLTGGNPGAPAPYAGSDLAGVETVAMGGLGISWGADNSNSGSVNRSLAFRGITEGAAVLDSSNAAVTSHGAALHYHLGTVDGLPGLIGYIGSDPSIVANQIFKVTLDDTSASGTYKFTLLKNFDHPAANTEDDISINFGFTAKDADGDAVDGSFRVTVDDDSPVINAALVQNGFVDEERLAGGNPDDSYANGDLGAPDDDGNLTASGSLGISFGVDGPAAIVTGGIVLTPHAFNFDNGTNLGAGYSATAWQFRSGFGHTALVGALGAPVDIKSTSGHPFELNSVSLGMFGTGGLKKVLITALDINGNPIAGKTVSVDIPTMSPDTGETTVTFNPASTVLAGLDVYGLRIVNDPSYAGQVFVDNLQVSEVTNTGSAIIDGPITFTDHSNFAAAASNVSITDSNGNNVDVTSLTSHGIPVKFALLDAMTLVAYTGATPTSINDSNVVFSAVLSAASASGSYNFVLKAPLDHPLGGTEDDLIFAFKYTAKDFDGDTTKGTFTVTVDDDAPEIVGAVTTGLSVDEDDLAHGNDQLPNEPLSVVGSLNVSFGADDGSVALAASGASWNASTHTLLASDGAWKIVLNNDGTYTFTLLHNTLLHGPADNGENPLNITVSYTATDGDHDSITGTFSVTVVDDVPVLSASEVGATNYIVNGQFTDNGGFGPLMGWDGQSATAIAGWTISGHELERNPANWYVTDPVGGGRVVDLDASPGNVSLSQTFSTLVSGQVYTLSFDAAKPAGFDAHLEVYWNGVLIPGANITPLGTGYQQFSFNVIATGSDTLEFRETGVADNGGTFLANVSLRDSAAIVDEDGLNNGIAGGQGDAPGASVIAAGSLGIRWGADDNDTNDSGGVQDGTSLNAIGGNASALTGRAVFFTDGDGSTSAIDPVITATVGSTQIVLKSAGQEVHYQVVENGTKVIGYVGADWSDSASQIFTLSLSDDLNGSYKFTLLKPLDHPMSGSEDDIALKFGFTARDSDGDTTSGSVVITVDDDSPTLLVTIPGVSLVDGALAGDANDFQTPGNWSAHAAIDTGGNLDAGAWQYSAAPFGGSQVQLERVDSGYRGVTSSNGNPLIDLEASPGNMQVSQTLHGLSQGQGLQISFEIGQAVDGGSARLEVFWNNISVGIFDPPRGAAQPHSVTVTALAGDNVLTFREIGQSGDNTGTFLTNVSATNVVIIDETRNVDANSNDVTGIGTLFAGIHGVFGTDPGMDQPQYAQGVAALVAVTANYGADGPAAGSGPVYALKLGLEGVPSGLTTTDNKAISLFTDGAFILGRYESDGNAGITSADKIAFALRIDPTTGVVSIAQYVSLHHPDVTTGNDSISLASGALSVNVTVTDRDGDSASQDVDVSGQIRFRDDGPTLTGTPISGTVSESDLPFVAFDFHSLKIAFGADGPSAHLTFARDGNGNPIHPEGITSDGVPLLYGVRLSGSGEEQLVAYKQGETINNPVFIVELSSPANPTYVFTLYQNLDHTGANGGSLPLGFTVLGTDLDGDSVAQNFIVNVLDDGPVLTGTPDIGSVTEAALPGIFGNQAIHNLKIDFGGDGPSEHLAFARDGDGNPLHPAGITSDHVPLLYVIRLAGSGEEQLVAYKQGQTVNEPVFIVELTSPPNPNYVFTLFQNLDHTGANDETLPLSFTVVGTDTDGDGVTQNFTVNVADDTPMAKNVSGAITENETGTFTLVDGVDYSFGADGGSITLGTPSYSNVPVGVNLEAPVVTLGLDGHSIVVGGGFDALSAGATAVLNIPYTVTDGDGDTVTKTLSVTITGTNDAPSLQADSQSISDTFAPDAGLVIYDAGSVLANDSDVDAGDTRSVSGIKGSGDANLIAVSGSTTAHGTYGDLIIGADGHYTYKPNAAFDALKYGQNPTDVFTYEVKDALGQTSTTTLTINITGHNDAPSGADSTIVINEDTPRALTAADFGFTDAENNVFDAVRIAMIPLAGQLLLNGVAVAAGDSVGIADINAGHLTFAPGLNGNGAGYASFSFQVHDNGGTADTGQDRDQSANTITFNVTPINDNASISGTSTGSVTEDGTLTASGVLTVHDVDLGENVFQTPGSLIGQHGTFTFAPGTGAWTYALNNLDADVQALNNGESLHDTLVVKSLDGTATETIDVTINGVSDALPPVAVTNDSPYYAFSQALAAPNAAQPTVINFDADNIFNGGSDTFTYTFTALSGFDSASWLTVNAANGTVTGNPTNLSAVSVFRIDAVDNVTHEASFAYVAFSALDNNGRFINITNSASYASADARGDVVFVDPNSTVPVATPILGDSSSDVLIGNNNGNTLNGNSQNDAIYGNGGNDFLYGESGSDYLNGGAGDDFLDGGSQNDVLDGGEGNDTLLGGAGDDILLGGAGDDTLDGGFGANRIYGGAGDDTIIVAQNGDVLLDGGAGTDTLRLDIGYFNNVADSVIVNIENITMTVSGTLNLSNQTEGLTITDSSTGGSTLTGGSGNDIIVGGKGADTLRGGAGSDTFRYLSGDANAVDKIEDFQTGASGDTIDLSGLLSSLAAGDRESHVRFLYSNGQTHTLSNDGAAAINVDNTAVTLQVDLGGWKSVATITDTGGNLTAGADVINMMLNAGTTTQYHV